MKPEDLIGMNLDNAMACLRRSGHEDYRIKICRAPRRPDGVGALHVLKVDEQRKEIIVCSFMTELEEKA